MRSNQIGYKKYLFLLLPWNLLTFKKSINLPEDVASIHIGRKA